MHGLDKPNTNESVDELKTRFHQFIETLDTIEPETADLNEIDRLIGLVDELEQQMEKIKLDK